MTSWITKWKEVKKILKEETQAAERVKMLEKEVDEKKKANNYASLVPRLFPVPWQGVMKEGVKGEPGMGLVVFYLQHFNQFCIKYIDDKTTWKWW